jgi:outer membrane protein assembly factor BamB
MFRRQQYLFQQLLLLTTIAVFALAAPVQAQNWVQFRGPGGLGVADGPVPTEFGPNEGLAWKTQLPGGGGSSPVIWGDRIFLTSFTGYAVPGEASGSLDKLERHVLCLDRATGDILWDKTVPSRLPEEENIRESHGYASNTPAVDADRVYAFFGKSGVFAFDHDGNQLWQANVGDGLNGWGSGASPVLHENLVLINASVESESLVALDRKSGDEVWRARGVREAWNTPHLATTADGKTEIIVPIIEQVLAFDPQTGKQLWNCRTEIGWYMAPSAVSRDGIVYAIGGRPGQSLAVRTGGRGDVTETHRLWIGRKGSNVPSPILHGDYLYWIHDNLGIASCARADTGELVYEERINRLGMVYASPILAGEYLYYISREGKVLVVKVGPKYELVASTDLKDGGVFNASPAALDGKLYIRSDGWLYCFGGK